MKVPGQKPRGSRTVPQTNPHTGTTGGSGGNSESALNFRSGSDNLTSKKGEKVTLTGYEMLKDPTEEANNNENENKDQTKAEATTPNVKKRNVIYLFTIFYRFVKKIREIELPNFLYFTNFFVSNLLTYNIYWS